MSRSQPPDPPRDRTADPTPGRTAETAAGSPPDELAGLPPALEPPPDLEERVVAALRRRDLVLPWSPRRPAAGRRYGWLAAACLLAALGGWAVGWSGRGPAPTAPGADDAGGRQYLLLLVEPRPLTTDKPLAALVDEYRSWAAGLAREGHLVSAGRLEHRPGTYLAESRQPPPGIAHVTGFFVLRGRSLAEAEAIAATCPHLGYGGEISVRELAGSAVPPDPAAS